MDAAEQGRLPAGGSATAGDGVRAAQKGERDPVAGAPSARTATQPEETPPSRPELQQTSLAKPRFQAPNISFTAPDVPLALAGPYIGPVRQGPADRDFMVVSRMPPQYPYRAQRRGIEGWVKVSLLITEQGTVQDVVVVEARPEGVFDNAALQAVMKWKFKPRIQHGQAVAVRAEQVVTFKLDGK